MSDAFWLGIFGLLTMIVKEIIDWRRAVRAENKIAAVKKQVDVIEVATNSMKDALIVATEKEALVRGGVEERARADDRAKEEARIAQQNLSGVLARAAEAKKNQP